MKILKIQVPFALLYFFNFVPGAGSNALFKGLKILLNNIPSFGGYILRGIIAKIFGQCQDCIGGTKPFNEAGDRKLHKMLASSSHPVA